MHITREQAWNLFGNEELENIHPFKLETQEGNKVEGYICKSKRGYFKGPLLIVEVNGDEVLQYVQSMPKLNSLNRYTPHLGQKIYGLLKADGTNITIFPLLDKDGECIEALPKTRNMPDLNKGFKGRYNESVTEEMINAVFEEKYSFSYEIYGQGIKKHNINYNALGISLSMDLLTILDKGKSLPFERTRRIAKKHSLPMIMEGYRLETVFSKEEPPYSIATPTEEFLDLYSPYIKQEAVFEDGDFEAIFPRLKKFFDLMNLEATRLGHGTIIEGLVWHWGSIENYMIKNKAYGVEEGTKVATGISGNEVRMALLKAEENIGLDDRVTAIDYALEELKEDNPKEIVETEEVRKKIMSAYRRMTREMNVTDELKEFAKAVIAEVGEDATDGEKMQAFARMFPDKKKLSGKVFQVFAKMR